MYKFEKVAGLILDHQDDPGFGWDYLSQYWPDELEPPNIGESFHKDACIGNFSPDGHEKIARYPIDTASNTLASSMYFVAFGLDAIDKTAHQEIAESLQEARIGWGTHLPSDFVNDVIHQKTAAVHEVFADYDQALPVTTPEQTEASINFFQKNASHWRASERMILASRLEKAAEVHELDVDIPMAKKTASENAVNAIEQRFSLMGDLSKNASFNARNDEEEFDSSLYDNYLSGLEGVLDYLDSAESYQDVVKVAELLEGLDQESGMDECWGVEFPDAVDSILYGVEHYVFGKTASPYGDVDWTGLSDTFSGDIVDAISSDPETVIPTLPTAEKKIVEDYVNGQL